MGFEHVRSDAAQALVPARRRAPPPLARHVHGAPAANVLDSYEPGAALLAARLALAFALALAAGRARVWVR